MAKARLYFDGDNSGIEKEARIYSLTQEVEDKLDSISNFQNEIDGLQEQINNLASRGRYLSTWNAVTGLPETNPQVDPYVYRAGDYYIVSVVGGTNYRPQGSEYHIGVASQALETQLVEVNDLYIYDGVQWIKQGSGSSVNVTWGSIVGALSNQTDLQNALNDKANKADVLEKTNTTSYTPTGDYNPATKKYVDDNDTFIGATAPTNNVIEGRLWYDTAADVLKVWNGSARVPTGKTYTAGSHINISNADVISTTGLQEELTAGDNITIEDICTTESDMKGPAPSGFHVPTKDEWNAIRRILITTFSMASNATTVETYLKMPIAGYRYGNNSSVYDVGVQGHYWFSTPYGDSSAYCFTFFRTAFSVESSSSYHRMGNSIRCLKNSPSIPTSSRTTLYDGSSIANDAGIFWDETEGLISISGDGVTWYTIQDKNLGATVVYNSGDTLTDNNCGYFYQWGNNYGFPHSGNVTKSSTQVDASTYGPGNYYYSDTFITTNPRSNVVNNNLRGGVTQGTWQDCALTISATDTTYTAGTGINIDSNNEISIDASVVATQTDLQNGLDEKQDLLTAGENITIEDECTTESDMKGPSPSGFHVPTKSEREGLVSITYGLGITHFNDLRDALYLPYSNYRKYSDGEIFNVGGRYWTSTATGGNNAYYLSMIPNRETTNVIDQSPRGCGITIRCFKNSYVAPASSWVVINGTLGSGGVFHNTTEGIISVTADGITGYTIMDKNLGAENLGDIGYYYQWGNNYGFQTTGTISQKTTTAVDASLYGPGNYYSNSAYFTGYNWDTSDNTNLRGGVSQGTYQDCIYNVISATDTTYVASDFDIKDLTDSTGLRTTWSGKQDALTAGSHIDITSNVVSATGLQEELVAGDNITIGDECTTESDMKGPCSSGFHIGTSAEWTTLKNTWVGLGQDGAAGDVFAAKFKIPFGNYRWAGTNANTSNQGTNGMYWTSTPSSGHSAYFIVMRSGYFSTDFEYARTYGFSVRPFKNTPVAPDSTWTTILDGSSVATGAGIFYNATEGLISASSNGTTWTTIADKNVGATVAWNEGDALNADNCGGLFQWGNNYMFPFSGTVSGTTTLVDTTGYGPGNYYYSDLFNTTYQDWASPHNNNLWGGVTQGTWQDCIHNVISATVPSVSVVSDDIGVTYHITVSNSDPASGTASNIITLVP